MVWNAVQVHGKTNLIYSFKKVNSNVYTFFLETQILGHGCFQYAKNLIFQQDNASRHTTKAKKKQFNDNNIPLFDWPSRFHNMNFMKMNGL